MNDYLKELLLKCFQSKILKFTASLNLFLLIFNLCKDVFLSKVLSS
jgi:hypothetical protein